MGRLSQPFYLTVIYDFQPACLRVLKCYSAVDRGSPTSTQPRLPSEIRKQEKVIKNPSGDWWVALCVVVVMRGLDREMTWKSAMHFLFSLTTNLLQTTTRRVGQTEKHLSCQVSVRLSFHRDSQIRSWQISNNFLMVKHYGFIIQGLHRAVSLKLLG